MVVEPCRCLMDSLATEDPPPDSSSAPAIFSRADLCPCPSLAAFR